MKKILVLLGIMIATIGVAFAQAPSISKLLNVEKELCLGNIDPLIDMLENGGYVYRFTLNGYDGVSEKYILSKNCKVLHEERTNGIEYSPVEVTGTPSIITIYYNGTRFTGFSVNIYSESGFNIWVSQMKKLGFKQSEHERGNQGQDWQFTKPGGPNIYIWNDYGNTYSLDISY